MVYVVLAALLLASASSSSASSSGASSSFPGTVTWTDWDGLQVCYPMSIQFPESEAKVVEMVRSATMSRYQVKVVGAGHSFSSIAITDATPLKPATILSLDKMDKVLDIDPHALRVTVEAGIRVHVLNDRLLGAHLALPNTGAIAMQSVAGATQTSTHGTGRNLGSMSTGITAMRVVLANGTVLELDEKRARDKEMLQAARVGLGALGVVTQVTLKVVPAFKLRRTVVTMDLDELIYKLPEVSTSLWY